MSMLSREELEKLLPAESASFPSPIPTQIVSSDEFLPPPQNARQKKVEALLKELGAENARKNGMSRRKFFGTAAGLATAFVAMNKIYGPLFEVSTAEAQ